MFTGSRCYLRAEDSNNVNFPDATRLMQLFRRSSYHSFLVVVGDALLCRRWKTTFIHYLPNYHVFPTRPVGRAAEYSPHHWWIIHTGSLVTTGRNLVHRRWLGTGDLEQRPCVHRKTQGADLPRKYPCKYCMHVRGPHAD